MSWSVLFLYWYGDHRELHVRTHSFPTRLSSELKSPTSTACIFIANGGCSHKPEAARLADALLDRLGLLNERPKPRELYELTVRGCAGGRLPVLAISISSAFLAASCSPIASRSISYVRVCWKRFSRFFSHSST